MEKERRIKVLSMVALIVAVLGLTVAFASLSQTLTINGTASVNAASWDIHFEDLSEPVISGAAEIISDPVIENSTFSGLNVKLTKPGDGVYYTFKIVNAGTITAVMDENSFFSNFDNLSNYDWNGDGVINSNDEFFIFEFYFDYNKDGIIDQDEEEGRFSGDPLEITKLTPGDSILMKVELCYDNFATSLPAQKEFTIGPLTFSFDYIQSNN